MSNKNFRSAQFGSYPYIGVLINISIALCITGILGTILLYANRYIRYAVEHVEVEIYLQREITPNVRFLLEKELATLACITKDAAGKARFRYVSRQEATAEMQAQTGEDFVTILGESPLPDSYYVQIAEDCYEKGTIDSLKTRIEGLAGVLEVDFQREYISQMQRNFRYAGIFFVVFALVFFVAAVALIDNAIRLALFSQRFLIRSMQLVGASPMFIKKPFLRRALWHGLIGGSVAIAIVWLLMTLLHRWIDGLSDFHSTNGMIMLSFFLLIFGAAISTLSAYIAVSRYLNKPLEELY
ncbi:MAG: hypothetical protein JJT94_01125 [Bernardetiaceae bacterium]|nr:hypothetical protein [Bernardetiaceae bacterium]